MMPTEPVRLELWYDGVHSSRTPYEWRCMISEGLLSKHKATRDLWLELEVRLEEELKK